MFAYRLALQLGIWDVDAWLATISHRQLIDWYVFCRESLWGEEREFWRAGMVASVVANCAATRKRGAKTFKPADFVPKAGKTKAQTQQQIQQRLMAYFGVRTMIGGDK